MTLRSGSKNVILSGFLGLTLMSAAWASDFHSPRTTALGGAGHAGPILNDAIYLNPSFASFLPVYSVSLNYLHFTGAPYYTPSGPMDYYGRNYNFSLQDGRNEFFQAGVGFTQQETGRFVNIGASKAFVKRWGVGMGGKFYFNNDPQKSWGQDMIGSTSFIIAEWLHVAAIVDNILETEQGKERGLYREFLLGAKLNIKGILMLYFDPHFTPGLALNDQRWGHESGLELTMFKDFFLRGGFFKNAFVPFQQGVGDGVAAGIGWVSPRFSLDYGFKRVMSGRTANQHIGGMTLFF